MAICCVACILHKFCGSDGTKPRFLGLASARPPVPRFVRESGSRQVGHLVTGREVERFLPIGDELFCRVYMGTGMIPRVRYLDDPNHHGNQFALRIRTVLRSRNLAVERGTTTKEPLTDRIPTPSFATLFEEVSLQLRNIKLWSSSWIDLQLSVLFSVFLPRETD